MANAIEPEGRGYVIPAAEAPNDDQRAFMARRVGEIGECLTPAPAESVLSELAALFRTMAIRGGDEGELEAVIRVYMGDLADVPLFALTQACRDFRRGDAGNGTFAPTPAELRRQAMSHVEPWAVERVKLTRILDARVLPAPTHESEDRKQAALAHIRETAEILKNAITPGYEKREAHRLPTRDEAETWLQRYQSKPPAMPKLSDAARAVVGLTRDEAAV